MLRLGIVDFDSSHCVEFTRRFNHVGVDRDQWVDGARVVLGWPGTSVMSPERIGPFARQVAQCGVELVESPRAMLGRIDAVLVLSVCGQPHRDRVLPFLQAGVPAFVDKPLACSVSDAAAIIAAARASGTTVFSSSALRYSADVLAFTSRRASTGPVLGAMSYGPAKRAEGNPGLFHYGIHAVEVLLAVMGPGCQAVATTFAAGAEVVTATWNDGRIGVVRGARLGATAYGLTAFCERAVVHQHVSTRYAYRNLCREIVRSFESGVPSVSNDATLEIVRFIAAALRSEQAGGERVALADVAA